MVEDYPCVQLRIVEPGGPRMACAWGLTYRHGRLTWVKLLLHKKEAEELAQQIASAESQEQFPVFYCRKWRVRLVIQGADDLAHVAWEGEVEE